MTSVNLIPKNDGRQVFCHDERKPMLLGTFFDTIELYRKEKMLIARFLKPFRSVSSCRTGGGFSSRLEFVCNHQCCEPRDHFTELNSLMIDEPDAYHKMICDQYGLPSEKSSMLETAANMNNAAIEHAAFGDMEVACLCTGGVESNPMRAGDPASVYEDDGQFKAVDGSIASHAGTINLILFINRSLTDAALIECVVSATEAKAAALQELEINSRYSDSIATGTGTDQIFVAARIASGVPLTSAGKHTKLGELIARVSLDAIKKTLIWQNSLTPNIQCSCLNQLGLTSRDEPEFCNMVCAMLDETLKDLFRKNFISVNLDPPTVAAVSVMRMLRQKFLWVTLPQGCLKDIYCAQAAQIACCVSGKLKKFEWFVHELSKMEMDFSQTSFMKVIHKSFSLGFEQKWR